MSCNNCQPSVIMHALRKGTSWLAASVAFAIPDVPQPGYCNRDQGAATSRALQHQEPSAILQTEACAN